MGNIIKSKIRMLTFILDRITYALRMKSNPIIVAGVGLILWGLIYYAVNRYYPEYTNYVYLGIGLELVHLIFVNYTASTSSSVPYPSYVYLPPHDIGMPPAPHIRDIFTFPDIVDNFASNTPELVIEEDDTPPQEFYEEEKEPELVREPEPEPQQQESIIEEVKDELDEELEQVMEEYNNTEGISVEVE